MPKFRSLLFSLSLSLQPLAAPAQDLVTALATVTADLFTHVGVDESLASFSVLPPKGPLSADTMGHVMLLSRRFDHAALYFALASATEADAATLNNLTLALDLTRATAPEETPDSFLDTALLSIQTAIEIEPDNAVMQNNLGNILSSAGRTEEAVAAYRRATELDPSDALYPANLAEALFSFGDKPGAAAALGEAAALLPTHPAVTLARQRLGSDPLFEQAVRSRCDINYHCDDICPHSIIGGLMNVQCEMENSSARIACGEGRAYAVSYNCQEDFPEYGILIPGLNSGFTVLGPGIKVHVLFDGNGDIRFQSETGLDYGMVGVAVESEGTYRRDTGDVVVDKVGAKVQLALLPEEVRPADVAGDVSLDIAHVEIIGNDMPLEIPLGDLETALATR